MKDPWRAPDPKKKSTAPTRRDDKIDLQDKDWDADIQPARSCPIRFPSCTIEVRSRTAQTLGDAITCVQDCLQALRVAGFAQALDTTGAGAGALPERPKSASSVSCDGRAIWFRGKTLDEGSLALARFLSIAARHPLAGSILRKFGITAMVRA